MSESHEYKLAESLVWSNQDFSLAEFVESYQLPQVVMVEVGFCGTSERTTFSSGQILTLHYLHTTSKAVCKAPHTNAMLIPMTCQLTAEVIPMDCYDSLLTARQLSTAYQNIKYMRVMELDSTWNNNNLEILKPNDILHIKKIERKNSIVKCKNLNTGEIVSIPIDSTAVFVPLAGPLTYTLAEVKKNFGFPAKVRFLDREAERKLRNPPVSPVERQPPTLLADHGQLKVMEEIQISDVIVTTVCSNLDEKLCLNVPTTLDIRVTVAEGFLSGNETYQKVVKTLDKQFKRTDLKAFEDLDVYEHMDAVKRTMSEMSRRLSVEEASSDAVHQAQQQMEKNASLKKLKNPFASKEKPPPIPSRQKSSSEKVAPVLPPKPGPKPPIKSDSNKKEKKFKLPLKSPDWLKRIPNPLKDENKETASNNERYEMPQDKSEDLYESVDEIYEDPDQTDSDSAQYTELDNAYIPSHRRPYESLQNYPDKPSVLPKPKEIPSHTLPTASTPNTQDDKKSHMFESRQAVAEEQSWSILPPKPNISLPQIPNNELPPLPITCSPKTEDDKQAIYEAIARFPQDLSGLSVSDVSRLLRYLGMGSYVETFQSELVDGNMLASMDQESLESLNVTNVFHTKKLLKFIAGWRPNV